MSRTIAPRVALLLAITVDALAVQIEAAAEDGRRRPVIRLASARPEWRTRYWLTEPMRLPRGTVLEVTAILDSAVSTTETRCASRSTSLAPRPTSRRTEPDAPLREKSS
ncbi:MAG: hypothetical protein CL471_06150 [Acidobacteria bacterium]|nr:hypothetical protein [Acidobacteriota bacterium]